MEILNLIKQTRSYRRYDENHLVSLADLKDLVECARIGASGRNQQSLKYIIVNNQDLNAEIFPLLSWAGYLKDWDGPVQGERPTGYIIVLNDKTISENHFCDEGIALQNMMLCATTKGLGSCIIAAFKKKELTDILNIPDIFEVLNVLTVGKPAEKIALEEIQNDDFKYWRDDEEIHHVPKRSLSEVIIRENRG